VGSVTANPLSVAVIVPQDPVRRGRWFRIAAEVTNGGSKRLNDVRVTLVRPQGLRLDPGARQTIPRIPPTESRRVRWEACSNTPGNYVLLARADAGAFDAESPAAVVEVVSSNRTC
jgi:uncharacterized membrane protein